MASDDVKAGVIAYKIAAHAADLAKGHLDEMANSRRALSLVYPNYGSAPGMWRFRGWLWRLWPKPFPLEIGVHAFIEGRWVLLGPADIENALRVVSGASPAFVDLRS